jgi:hypothetical protein
VYFSNQDQAPYASSADHLKEIKKNIIEMSYIDPFPKVGDILALDRRKVDMLLLEKGQNEFKFKKTKENSRR